MDSYLKINLDILTPKELEILFKQMKTTDNKLPNISDVMSKFSRLQINAPAIEKQRDKLIDDIVEKRT